MFLSKTLVNKPLLGSDGDKAQRVVNSCPESNLQKGWNQDSPLLSRNVGLHPVHCATAIFWCPGGICGLEAEAESLQSQRGMDPENGQTAWVPLKSWVILAVCLDTIYLPPGVARDQRKSSRLRWKLLTRRTFFIPCIKLSHGAVGNYHRSCPGQSWTCNERPGMSHQFPAWSSCIVSRKHPTGLESLGRNCGSKTEGFPQEPFTLLTWCLFLAWTEQCWVCQH